MASAEGASLPRMSRSFFLGLLLVSSTLHAGDVYVWVDQDGRKQISDVVPEKYRSRASRVWAPEPPAPAVDQRSAAAGGTAAPARTGLPQAPTANDCNLRWQLYRDSLECLEFYEYALRGLDADARPNCPVVAQPQDCAPPAMGISSK